MRRLSLPLDNSSKILSGKGPRHGEGRMTVWPVDNKEPGFTDQSASARLVGEEWSSPW